jgi:hypothetical protein
MRRSNGYYFYTLEVVVSKVESPTVCFELKTMILFRMSMWPAVYDEGPPEGASTSLRYDDLALPDPTTVAFLRSWSRMVIMQKEIPRMGLVCIVRVINCERLFGHEGMDIPGIRGHRRRSHCTGIL